MIATVAQYRVTEDRMSRFVTALAALGDDDASPVQSFQRRAISDTISALEEELASYDRLSSGEIDTIVVERIADLPRALVEGRIVAGLDQRELARISGHSVLRIERWERDGYPKVAFATMVAIAGKLPVELREDAIGARPTRAEVARGLKRAGLPKEIRQRILDVNGVAGYAVGDEIDRRLEALFGIGGAGFVAGHAFAEPPLRFKLPANAEQDRTRAYATYVEGVSAIVSSVQRRPTQPLPRAWSEMRAKLFPTGKISLESAVRQCWTMGIGVLPLRDSVAFSGACRRSDGKATIVLKQSTRHHSRWLFDLVHEIFHLVAEPADFTLLEAAETAPERRTSQLERRADRFAALVLTGGRLEEALTEVGRRAGGRISHLAAAVTATATALAIPRSILANLVAENVQSSTGRNWWGSAHNLQPQEEDAWKVVRDVFLTEADLGRLKVAEAGFVRALMETADA